MQTQNLDTNEEIEANIKPIRSISAIWFVPLVAVLIGAWMVYHQWSNQGSIITISFKSAVGMEIGKTKIKSRNVDIGEVFSIELNEASDGVIVKARMSKSAEKLLVEDSHFWVVSPKITHTGISGLSTLISGVYIEMTPGVSNKEKYQFTALADKPVTPKGTPGLHITLNSNDQFAYKKGDPIIYKGLSVGQFEDIHFNFEERIVYYNAFIKAPYHKLLTSNTKFWDTSGLTVKLEADGITVKTGNIETMLTNGVAFDVPEGMPIGDEITERDYFDIYPDFQTASDQRYKHSLQYVILVSDTIRGLTVGAPVEYRGVLIGHVESVNLIVDTPKTLFSGDVKIPVLINLQPARVGLPDNQAGVELMNEQHQLWVKKGLKARLRTGNLLTGSLFVELQHYDKQPVDKIERYASYQVIPIINDEFSQITAKVSQFVDSLNNLKLDELSGNSNQMIIEFTQTAKDFQAVSKNLELLLQQTNQQELIVQLNKTLENIATMSSDFSSGSKSYNELNKALSAITNVMHELNPLLNQLKNKPNGLIFNSGSSKDIKPKKYDGDNNE
jgi:paraquat-inducible protein B